MVALPENPFAVVMPGAPNQGLCVAKSPAWIDFGSQGRLFLWVVQ
ncbi:hypothetical protein [Mastigocladopsis repens]|nr:hypothetical protein [Mastigocladopsis repens]